ncbi:MAG: ATP-binding protein [Succinivibrionaceae bacterium]|nr:ATP-binding protein [Succinivibrionaceae bacterium]
MSMRTIKLPASVDQLKFVNQRLDEILAGEDHRLIYNVQLLVEELLVNISRYAYGDQGGTAEFRCGRMTFDGQPCTMLTIIDGGREFDPFTAISAPDINASLEDRQEGGLGIYFVSKLASHYTYARIDNQNVVSVYLLHEHQDQAGQ